jgi:hypothetical protein
MSHFIERHIVSLNNGVSLKVKHSVRSAMRCTTKENAIRRTRLKFVQITTLQDKALEIKRTEMRDGRLASKVKLKGGQIQDQVQENSIGDITCNANSIGLKASKSLMLIEHRHCHLN